MVSISAEACFFDTFKHIRVIAKFAQLHQNIMVAAIRSSNLEQVLRLKHFTVQLQLQLGHLDLDIDLYFLWQLS